MARYRSLLKPLLLLLAAAAALTLYPLGRRWQAARVLSQADPAELKALGAHLVVGYSDEAQLETWVKKRYVGGLYVTSRNLRGRTLSDLRARFQSLQAWRAAQGLPPLWIMADQEGGEVSRLSPLLTRLPPLSSLAPTGPGGRASLAAARAEGPARVDSGPPPTEIAAYAEIHARELADIGVNVNLAPVVDLAPPWKTNPYDTHTRLSERAISADPQTVALVAHHYCARLLDHGLYPVLKHFPGLGRVRMDTHDYRAVTRLTTTELAALEWVPFMRLSESFPVWIMLSHAVMADVDTALPASQSRAVIQGLLRKGWGADNVLITDDLCMKPFRDGPGGIGAGALRSLNAGADLLLVSHHPELGDRVLAELLAARRSGELDAGNLSASDRRLAAARARVGRVHPLFSANSR